MKRIIAPTLLPLLLVMISVQVTPAQDKLPLFKAEYELHNRGLHVAHMTRELTPLENGNYLFRSETHAVGLISLFRKDKIIEESTWTLENGHIRPELYQYAHTGTRKERRVTVDFDWQSRQITNQVNGSSWEMEVKEGTLDKLVYQYSIMLDLNAKRSSISYLIADGGKEKVYKFELVGEETINTPIGEFHTVKLIRHKPNSNQTTTLWCATGINYLPVKVENIEDDGMKTVAIISSLSGIDY